MNRKKQCGKHAVISGIRMPQLRCTRVSESGILRRVALALCACLLFTTVFVGCGTEASDEPVDPNKLQVMASFYTMYDFAQKIGGEHVQVTCMVPSGTEPHDWEPSTKDITRMEQTDVFIYNGAGMEHWVSDVLAGLSNKKLISVEASQGVSLLRSAEEEESHETGPSLILRKVGPEESLWSVAKQYRTTCRSILEVNEIGEESQLPHDRLLLIPRAK